MIVFNLQCATGHRFEGWFSSSTDFDDQIVAGQVLCPQCDSVEIVKAPMAPAVAAKSNTRTEQSSRTVAKPMANRAIPAEVQQALHMLAQAQAKALADSRWVGSEFAEESRAMHYGEKEVAAIHGKATLAEAKDLLEEGIHVLPLPFPVAEPDELN